MTLGAIVSMSFGSSSLETQKAIFEVIKRGLEGGERCQGRRRHPQGCPGPHQADEEWIDHMSGAISGFAEADMFKFIEISGGKSGSAVTFRCQANGAS
ncbi:hypothetical protein B0T25DRAFT_98372 [Lasiosphaeria hispida]|uniref:Uncharacterized protein n=1 Tax=Lasiosphaeria hispida TaxID=260671 RepID=A0AAJ0MHN7_9PEZI|nr:hypothetical protein B0T25DRAFT_98372 [Lasiosphaeria hispida]